MIDRETVDRIYAAANIVDIIGDYVTLKRKGVNYQACCPFHNEKTPSFVVSPSKGVYKCFGCGKGGNAVTFLMEHENITYPEALKMVAKRYGIEVREKELSEEEIRRNDDRESMFVLNGWAAEYFANYLHRETEGQSVGLAYFRQARGLTDATIRKFGLGFCPAKGDRMSKDALAAGYKKEFLLSTGLSLARERDGSLYDRFRDRVIFPVHNISGRVVAFGGRTLRTDKTVAKYQNSPESEIYSKKRELYGLYFAKRAIQQQDFAIMVEGYLDVISMHQAGIENVVASSGTSLTTEQIRLLGRFTKNITVIYDGDSAGIHASLRGIDMILKEGMNVRVVLLPEPEDPDSFARSHTASEVQAYIRDHERDFLEFKANLLLQDAEGDPIRKAALIGDMVQSIAQIPDPIQRSVYVKECARIMDIDENILISEVARKRLTTSGDREADEFLRRQAAQRQREAAQPEVEYVRKVEAGSGFEALEREIVKYLLKYGHCSFDFKEGRTMVACNVAEVVFDELGRDNIVFRNPVYAKIMETYRGQWERLGTGTEVPAHCFLNHIDPEVCNASVDILTSDDNYVPSQLWRRKEIHVESDAEMLAVGVPKAVTLYKSKVVEEMIKELQAKLGDESLPEEEQVALLQRLSGLNKVKVSIARRLQRLIL
ncbi:MULTISPECIES: DNA primase [Alistipes]|uniref:DNA primase n=1 Tax=Alistipes dispar TaxID=2585119 RepID=A0A4Y1X474_9BACT|nr:MULTISPECIES: DNA primase [Alistipes]MBQ4902551.1 DNA primase [Alistipes sp. Marseille-P2263]MCI2257833.1 DNA primase [Alistipes dispar]BBL07266.1 DNA primase [Alistipes dispar]HJC19765.1 DNA primase [Candidatus Alistipes stercoripullorum]